MSPSLRFTDAFGQQPLQKEKNNITDYLLGTADAEMGGVLMQNDLQPNPKCPYT